MITNVSRIVAQRLIPNPFNLPTVNHKNPQHPDDRIETLECIQQLRYKRIQGKFKKKPCSSLYNSKIDRETWEAQIWNSTTRKNESHGIFNTQEELYEINAENEIFETFYRKR